MRNRTSYESLVALLGALAAGGCDKSAPTPAPEPSATGAALPATAAAPPALSVGPGAAAPLPSASAPSAVGAKEIKVAPAPSASGGQMGCAPGACAPGACAANKK